MVKVRWCEKYTKFKQISHVFWQYIKYVVMSKQSRRFFQIFVALSEYLNFNILMKKKMPIQLFFNFSQKGWKNMVWNWGYNHRRQRFVKQNCSEWWFDLKIWSRTRKSFYSLRNQRFFVDFHRFSSSGFWLGSIQQKTVAYNKLFSPCFDTTMGSIQRKTR